MANALKRGSPRTTVDRLVEAEREWQRALDEARAAAASRFAAARAEIERRAREADAAIAAAVETRTRQLEQEIAAESEALRAELAAVPGRFRDASDEVVERIADAVAARAPWFTEDAAR